MVRSKGWARLGIIALVAVFALLWSPGRLFAGESATPSTTAAVVTVGMSAGVVGAVALLKQVAPEIPGRRIPLVVLAISAVFVIVAAFSVGGNRDPLTVLLTIVAQTMNAMGLREGAVAAMPGLAGKATATS